MAIKQAACSCGYQAQDDNDLAAHLLQAGAYDTVRGQIVLRPDKPHGGSAATPPLPPQAHLAHAPADPPKGGYAGRALPWLLTGALAAAVGIWGLPRLGLPLAWFRWFWWVAGGGFLAWQVAHFVEGPAWVFVWLWLMVVIWAIGPLRWAVLAVILVYRLAGA